MTVNNALKLEAKGGVLGKRKLPKDIVEFLEDSHYSKSLGEWIKIGDMDLIHFIRASQKRCCLDFDCDC